MTQNQINFAGLREQRRHNVEMERQGITSLAESERHNRQGESVNWYTAGAEVALRNAQAAYADTQRAWYPTYIGSQINSPWNAVGVGITNLVDFLTKQNSKGSSSQGKYPDSSNTNGGVSNPYYDVK